MQPSPDALESAGVLSVGTTTATAVLQHHRVIHQTSATLGGGRGGREGGEREREREGGRGEERIIEREGEINGEMRTIWYMYIYM